MVSSHILLTMAVSKILLNQILFELLFSTEASVLVSGKSVGTTCSGIFDFGKQKYFFSND
jgi:hypothetical protein